MDEKKKIRRVGLGVAGGIAAYKAVEILRGLQKTGCVVRVAMTAHATEFIQPLTFRALHAEYVLINDYAPDNPDPIAHINFSQNIDLLLIAPATANIIAKFAGGIADDFLSSTYLASTAPVLIAPAMNTTMWFQPATQRNVEQLKKDGVHFIEPVSGELACQTVGTGKLEDVENIIAQALEILNSRFQIPDSKSENPKSKIQNPKSNDLSGEKILLTVGGTREAIDPVRFISNHSSGKMGFALAEAAHLRGAKVTIIAGSVSVAPPENLEILNVVTAEEMHKAVTDKLKDASVYIGAAAVADYRPKNISQTKIKKTKNNLTIELEKTADILADVSKNRHENLLVVGFAAETNEVENYARSKMERKNLDMIVANNVSLKNSGFGSDNNAATVFTRDNSVKLPQMSKREMADKILDEMLKLRRK
ncbi:MAG: bifunctional phosphopantothenoylcysteine decarboxylase/phosphopantothenate--cysteine ligase CoaBC [Pyrinomonadaceae bacterium]